jgi:hypothetical protein
VAKRGSVAGKQRPSRFAQATTDTEPRSLFKARDGDRKVAKASCVLPTFHPIVRAFLKTVSREGLAAGAAEARRHPQEAGRKARHNPQEAADGRSSPVGAL